MGMASEKMDHCGISLGAEGTVPVNNTISHICGWTGMP